MRITEPANAFPLPVVLTIAGAISGYMTVLSVDAGAPQLFLGAIFGAVMGACLAISGAAEGLWAVQFAIVSTIVYFISCMASLGTQLALGALGLLTETQEWSMGHMESPSPISLLVGGLVGGLLIIGDVLLLASARPRKLKLAALCSIAGGALAVAGVAVSEIRQSLRVVDEIWPNAQRNNGLGPALLMYSVHIVWQAGMGLLIGLVLKFPRPATEAKGAQQ